MCVGGAALKQPRHSSFCYCSAAELHKQCIVTEEGATCMPYSLLPTWGAVLKLTLHRWSLSSPGMIILCVHPSFVLVSFECLCTFSPIIVSLWFPCPVNHKLIGLDTPLSSYHIPISALFPPFLPLVPLCIGTKGPPPLNGLTSLCSLCVLSLLCWLFWKRFSVRCFIYLSICIYFWVLWKSIGLASFQTVACYSFWLCFEGWVGWWFSYEPTKQVQHKRRSNTRHICLLSKYGA